MPAERGGSGEGELAVSTHHVDRNRTNADRLLDVGEASLEAVSGEFGPMLVAPAGDDRRPAGDSRCPS